MLISGLKPSSISIGTKTGAKRAHFALDEPMNRLIEAPNKMIKVNRTASGRLDPCKIAAPLMANPQMQKALAATHPLGRLGTADDFTALAALLLDNQKAGWITGQIFAVDGGRSSVQVNSRGRS